MKKILSLILLLAIFNMYNPVLAKTIEVKSGIRIPITVKSEFTSKNVQAGEKIDAIIDEDIKIKDVLVFKRGDAVVLNVSDVKKAGFLGHAGEMYLVNGEAIDANGDKRPIEYNRKITGEEKIYPKVCLGVSIFFLWPLALFGFVKGGQAKVSPSKVIDVSVRNDFDFKYEKL